MASLTKVQQLIFETTLTSADPANTNYTAGVISKEDLGLPGGNFPLTGTDRGALYFVNVKVLFVTADYTYDNIKTLDVILQWSGTESEEGGAAFYVTPTVGSQIAATNTIARLNDIWDVYITGMASDTSIIPGTPTITDDAINIIINKSAATAPTGSIAKAKVFVDIYAHADNALT